MSALEQLAEQTIAQMGDVFHDADDYMRTECPECGTRLCYTAATGEGVCGNCKASLGSPGDVQHAQIVESLVEALETVAHRPICSYCQSPMTPSEPKHKQDARTFLCECGTAATLCFHPPISTESARPEPARKKPGPKPDPTLAGRILAYIIECKRANDGLSPSYRDIRRALSLGSTNMVLRNIVALEKQGLITRHEHGIIVRGGGWTHVSNGVSTVDMENIERINDKLGLVAPDTQ